MGWAVQTHQLSRAFNGRTAVDALDLEVPQGAVFGFLGPNGAGKTTTIRMLLGLIRPDLGSIHLNGHDISTHRRAALSGVGAIVETPALFPNLTGRETLAMAARLLGRPARDIHALLELVELSDSADRQVAGYSLGMRQRLALARALIGEPKLLILDEPTNGLDPAGIASMRSLIADLPSQFGATVLVSSHLLNEVDQTATHCGLISGGRLIFQDTLAAMRAKAPRTLIIETDCPEALTRRFTEDGVMAEHDGRTVRAEADLNATDRAALVAALVQDGFAVSGLRVERQSLEALFLRLTRTERRF